MLVTGDNSLQLFLGWEGVGLASYLLIHFWFTRLQADKAAIKAMLVNRVGDFGLAPGISGCFTLFQTIGSHTWSPDAMEGPTPVSALIHAATMVTAGVFMIARCSPLFEYPPTALIVITFAGAMTSFLAATTGILQNDLKRVIAYSTCSQLGYMIFACGISNYSVSVFHLMNRVFQSITIPECRFGDSCHVG
ncbi:UNVERIFIED_CONTAM: NADH-ubiquinone oxidoreductase chain 5 [Sesamum angustifolium]|uniref:NADH-ubiquinone oxidoreductase chain 5 n=1 Tax=Sesamum angustifolium TaxID=2727405 RepID=A0AAW2JNU8_9LAMI